MGRPRDFVHVIRLAGVFAVGTAAFLVWRAWTIPPDFGVYGHYRAGALDDARALPLVHAGQGSCAECHADVSATRQSGAHAAVACETCHGPLARHAAGEADQLPARPDGRRTCSPCHAAGTGKPALIGQVLAADHAGTASCTECHQPHSPSVQ